MAEKYVKDRNHNRYPAYCCEDIDEKLKNNASYTTDELPVGSLVTVRANVDSFGDVTLGVGYTTNKIEITLASEVSIGTAPECGRFINSAGTRGTWRCLGLCGTYADESDGALTKFYLFQRIE